jgi:Uma2 family endonuclease
MVPGLRRPAAGKAWTTRKWPSGAGGDRVAAMNIALRRVLTISDYLAWAEAEGDGSHTELINGQIVPMSPELVAHNRIKGRVFIALSSAVVAAGIHGEVFTDGLTVPIDEHTAYGPDATLRLGAPLPARQRTVPDPVVVVEVLSPSSVHMDTSAKLIGYFKLPSVQHYLVIDPETRSLTHHTRGADGKLSAQTLSSGALRLDRPGITLDVAELIGP